jgi:hypothetical protein
VLNGLYRSGYAEDFFPQWRRDCRKIFIAGEVFIRASFGILFVNTHTKAQRHGLLAFAERESIANQTVPLRLCVQIKSGIIFSPLHQTHTMKNPVFNRRHIREYFSYGFLAALLYIIPVFLFLSHKKYEDFYYIYIGIGLFMFTIFFYALRLVNRPYDSKRAVSMLIAGNLATLAGVLFSSLMVIGSFFFFFPDMFSLTPTDSLIHDAPSTIKPERPSGLLFMMMILTVFANTSVGSFVSVITAYVGKKNQTRDKPASLDKRIHAVSK